MSTFRTVTSFTWYLTATCSVLIGGFCVVDSSQAQCVGCSGARGSYSSSDWSHDSWASGSYGSGWSGYESYPTSWDT
ncbi:MAG TPA: hypothetical protein VIY86_14885, partial [Pirellulaceae bacterium]